MAKELGGVVSKKKFWLEINGKALIGQGRYSLLKEIQKTNSLKKSASIVKISEKTAHNYISRIEKRLGEKIVDTTKGGKNAGGSTKLNLLGNELIKKFEKIK
ncbi:ModE family transcriptional regulator [Candidatus Woesearchaeota archaeon]|nr:ModE family transcriptional regulator [Candidatus Woesearchaeota archaeon]